jgi:uncharacterized coiled-coil protein SlyX
MRLFLGLLLAFGLAASPSMAGNDGNDKKDGDTKGTAATATVNTADKDKADKDKADAAKADDSSAASAAAAVESELQEMKELIKAQSQQLEEQRQALQRQQEQMRLLETKLDGSGSPTTPAASTPSAEAAATQPYATNAEVHAPSTVNPPNKGGGLHPQKSDSSPISFRIGNMDFTPGGFLDFTSVTRTTALGSGIGTSFGSIPFNTSLPAAGLSETRFSAQNSRVSLKAQGDFGETNVTGYVEADFLGYQPPNALVTSNSNSMRMRLYFADLKRGPFEIQAGQMWTFLTPNRTGLSPMPSDIFYSQDMDTNYQVGLTWARQAAVRFIVHPTKWWAFGISLENPEQFVPTTVVLPGTTFASQFDNGSSDTSSSAAVNNPKTPNLMPDIIVKTAFDGHLGEKHMHIEAAGLVRSFKVVNQLSTPAENSTLVGGGGSVNVNLELFKNFHAIANTYYSYGGGRYIFGLGPDVIVKSNGQLSGVHSGSGIAGFEWQTTPRAMLYGYYGGAYFQRNYGVEFNATSSCNGVGGEACIGFGFPGSSTSSNRAIQEGTIGIIPTLWSSPNYGKLQIITQYSYLTRSPWSIPAVTPTTVADPKNAHASLIYVDLRYTLP